MKKVLHMISSNGFYGAENVLLEICKGLQSSSQYYPVVALLNSGNKGHLPLLRECQKHELEYREFNCQGRFNRLVISELRKFIENNNIQIIHAHGYKSNFYASFARQPGQLLVSTCHNWIASGFKMRCFTWLDKFLLRRFDRIICVSKPVQLELKKWGVKAKNIFVVYNGVNIAKFRKNKESGNQIRRHLGVNDLDMVIGFVGRLSKEKGVDILMECASAIHEQFPGTHFVFVGDGPLAAKLENKKEDYIHFVGVQSDMPAYYSAFDIFILPSYTEGLPMVVLEAMASSLPVVASKVGSIPDVIDDKQTGYLVRPGSRGDVLDVLEKLLCDGAQARKVGENGCKRIERFFSSGKMVQGYASIYDASF